MPTAAALRTTGDEAIAEDHRLSPCGLAEAIHETRSILMTVGIVIVAILIAGVAVVLMPGDTAVLTEAASIGPSPRIPAPTGTLIPRSRSRVPAGGQKTRNQWRLQASM